MKCAVKTFVLTLLVLLPTAARGDTEAAPFSYAVRSTDGKYIFVMLAPERSEGDEIYLRGADGRRSQTIETKYLASGLYMDDGSTEPLWTVDWYSFSILGADGVHLVRRGPWAKSLSDEAFTFFANGKQLRSYKISDLVDTKMFLEETTSHFRWEESMTFDLASRTLTVVTLSKEKFVFDYTTGEMLSSKRPIRAAAVALIALLAFVVLMIIKRRRKFSLKPTP